MRFPILAIAAACLLAGAGGAWANQPRKGGILGYVTAESRYGYFGIVTGPVRRSPQGRLEVRLPKGTWLECGQSCRETLRRATIDFWKNEELRGDGPGYIRFRF